MLRTFCLGKVLEDHMDILKMLFVLRSSQKTQLNFTLCTNTHSLLQCTHEGERGTEEKEKFLREARIHTHLWICLGKDELPPHLPQITPKQTIPSPERGIWSLLHSYCVSLSLRLQTEAFNSIPLNLGGCSEVTDPCSQSSQLLFFLKRTINQIELDFMNEHF